MVADAKTAWHPVKVPRWSSQGERPVELVTGTCVWDHSGLPVVPLRWVLIRDPQGKFAPQALLCTDLAVAPEQILSWFVQRWQLETTFQEVRTHLGVERQRQWNDRAIERTTPALPGLFSLVTLCAPRLARRGEWSIRQAAWYHKTVPAFADALAAVRRTVWHHFISSTSPEKGTAQKATEAWLACLTETLCYAN